MMYSISLVSVQALVTDKNPLPFTDLVHFEKNVMLCKQMLL